MKHLFIINPAAGSRNQTEIYRKKIAEFCEGKNIDYSVELSAAPGCCTKIAREAAQSGEAYRIYACGGDGTLNEVVNGVAGFENVAITTFAGGSGNDFARMFSQPEAFRDLERLMDAEEAEFDLIDCNGDYSLNICSVGLDARIGTDVASYKRLPFLHGFAAYAASTVVNTIRGVHEHYVVEINGETIDGNQTLMCACNGQFYGGGFNPVPNADPTDGVLEVLMVTKVSRLKVAQVIGKYKNGKYKELPQYVKHYHTTKLSIESEEEMVINVDGETIMGKRADIKLIPGGIRFLHPKGMAYFRNDEKAEMNV